MADKTLQIVINARNASNTAFAAAMANVQKLKGQIDAIDTGLKLGATVAAVSGALSVASAATKAWRGDWEGVDEDIRKIPLGIGVVLGKAIDLGKEWAGHAEILRGVEEHQKAIAKREAEMLDLVKKINAERAKTADINEAAAKQEQDTRDPENIARNDAFRELQKSLKEWKAEEFATEQDAADRRAAIWRLYYAKIAEFERERNIKARKAIEELNEKMAAEAAKAEKEQADIAKRAADKRAAEREAEDLRQFRRLNRPEEDERRVDTSPLGSTSALLVSNRFTGLGATQQATPGERQQIVIAEKQERRLEKIEDGIDDLVQASKSGGGLFGRLIVV